ncbi:MAG TPA: lantibiotic dehydratase C-terminal domain-containing protein [Thermoanaerobaculia bacterium]|nr:lantibiotic dehydratase C-terminal domain-containing protein [Thermoanaerobaculia bacterium]
MRPQPLLSANIYCAQALDALIAEVITPFSRQVCAEGSYLWLIRHSRGGEHLKVRLHAPPAIQDQARRLLEEQVRSFFAALPANESAAVPGQEQLAVIDPEDAVDSPYPDRSLLWTTYQASPVTFGAPILLEDAEFQALFTRALGAGCRIALDLFAPAASEGAVPIGKRQSLVFKLVVLTWRALPAAAIDRAGYLDYHRDWLVRWMLAHSDPATTTRESVLDLFDRKAATMEASVGVLASALAQEDDDGEAEGPNAEYQRAIRDYFRQVQGFRGDPAYRLDPYTEDAAFLPLFKVLHNLANAIGLGIRHEAFTYHLLSRAAHREPK